MYRDGIVPDGKVDIVKAKEIWKIGGNLGDLACTNLLFDDQTDFESAISTAFESMLSLGSNAPNGKFKSTFDINSHSFTSLGMKFCIKDAYQIMETLDFNEIKTQLFKSEKSNQKSFLSVVYKTHLKVVLFLNKFKQYQLDSKSGSTIVISNESKFKIIKLLADAYRNFDALFVIRIPENKLQDVIDFINQLLVIDPLNIDARIISLGLKGIVATQDDRLKLIQDSLELYKNTDVEITFYNFQHLYGLYSLDDNYIQKLYKMSMDLNSNFKDQPSKIHIFQIMCKSLAYVGFIKLKENVQIDEFFIPFIETSEFFIKSLPLDHPYVCEMYYYLGLILARLCTDAKKNQVLKFNELNIMASFFKMATDHFNLISPIFSHRLGDIQELKEITSNIMGLYYCSLEVCKNLEYFLFFF